MKEDLRKELVSRIEFDNLNNRVNKNEFDISDLVSRLDKLV